MRRRITAVLGTLTGSAMLALLPVSAIAASGTFTYTTSRGVPERLINPNDNACYSADINGPAANRTDSDAVVFKGRGCTGSSTTLPPRESGNLKGRSVMFVH
ncbi:hypothetical protein [Streptomyces acidicola]|uniref:hypothetical protein n=1 Tax=Streptomyces acidicola TaxID=2596892 RepID=UPI003415E769